MQRCHSHRMYARFSIAVMQTNGLSLSLPLSAQPLSRIEKVVVRGRASWSSCTLFASVVRIHVGRVQEPWKHSEAKHIQHSSYLCSCKQETHKPQTHPLKRTHNKIRECYATAYGSGWFCCWCMFVSLLFASRRGQHRGPVVRVCVFVCECVWLAGCVL